MVTRILLLTHGGWGGRLLESAQMIIGKIDFVDEISLSPVDTLEDYTEKVAAYYQKLAKKTDFNQLLIITDVFGGTPNNVAAVLAKEHAERIMVFTGLNLPLLLESCSQIVADQRINRQELQRICQNSLFDVGEKIGIGGEQND